MALKSNIYITVTGIVILLLIFFVLNVIWFRPLFIRPFFYREMLEGLAGDPQTASKAKVPILYRQYRDEWNDLSTVSMEKKQERSRKNLRVLSSYKDSRLRPSDRISKQHLEWHLQLDEEGIPFSYHEMLINPYNGLQISLPGYLDTHHHISSKADVRAYIRRLEKLEWVMEQLFERMQESRRRKLLAPRVLLEASIDQMEHFIAPPPEKNFLYLSLQEKIDSIGIRNGEALLDKAGKAIELQVYPAYRRLIIYTRSLLSEAPEEAGLWARANGEDYYRFLLKKHTTLEWDPDSIHRLGIREVLRVKDEMIAQLAKMGISSDRRTVVEKVNALAVSPDYLLGYSISGRRQCESRFDSLIRYAESRAGEWFHDIPTTGLKVKRVPEFRQAGASSAFYEPAPIDGSAPGSFYIRMDILDHFPVFDMPTLAFHEGIPGHHFQLALQLESKDIPIYRKRYYNNAYIEGWAVYAERLMFESGAYENDPAGNLGRLRHELLRAARLVTDTGLHAKKWSRENAMLFLSKNSGLSREEIRSEVDRYLSDPGQACSYHLGMLHFLQVREQAKQALGDRFDLKDFHRVVLGEGMVSLSLLELLVDQYIAENR